MTLISIILHGNADKMVVLGQLVTGQVHIEAKKKIGMRGVRLEMLGKGRTSWTTGSGKDEQQHGGTEEYVNLEMYLTGSRDNATKLYLEPGAHVFPFSFTMPSDLPHAFESITGHVRYQVKVTIDGKKKKGGTAKMTLPVVRLLDLNNEPQHLREPISMYNPGEVFDISTSIANCDCDCNYCCCKCSCCCCCISGTVEANMRVNRGCFAPGETILVDGEFRNLSSSNVKRTSVAFVQKIKYFTYHKGQLGYSTDRVKVLAEVMRPRLVKGQSDCFQNISFQVPSLPPSRLDGCKIINIVYYIEMKAHYNALTTCNGRCEVIIGNVPLHDVFQQPVVTSQPMPFS